MTKTNTKNQAISYENSIKKSNELSMAKLNQGLTLNQMQLLAYAIYSTQQDGKTEFIKADFEKRFEIEKYQTSHAKEDAQRILDLKFSIVDLENDYFEYWNVFQSIKYDGGSFYFKWTEDMIPHILELKHKYVITDLKVTSQFNSGFSWTLYEYLKAHYGYWYKEVSKDALMKLCGVQNVKSYQKNTGLFKTKVLDLAIREINQYTELEVWYTEVKKGRSILGFELQWSTGKRKASATKKQVTLLRKIHNEVDKKMFDYISLENTSSLQVARTNIMKIKEINQQVDESLTSDKAKNLISEAKILYNQLEGLLEIDSEERDKSVYFNWLEKNEE